MRQIHSRLHKPSCFKYSSKKCFMRFPRRLVEFSTIDGQTGVVYLRRDHKWLSGFNEWLSIMTRANHDCQFILTKAHAIASIHYIIKYISKQEASLHLKLTLTAAVHKAMEPSSNLNTDIAKKWCSKCLIRSIVTEKLVCQKLSLTSCIYLTISLVQQLSTLIY